MSGSSAYQDHLSTVVSNLRGNVGFALAHESSLYGWGIDNNVMLSEVDVMLFDDDDFCLFGCTAPTSLGEYAEAAIDGVPVRLWSRSSLGLGDSFAVTACTRYGCESLAPELVLAKLPYSPSYFMLMENRARLASIVYVDRLDDVELSLVAKYVRGD